MLATCIVLQLQLAAAPATAPERLVTGTGLRIREAPNADAKIVEKVSLGAVLPCLEESAPTTVGDKTAPFCRAKNGWYFTALTEPVTDRSKQIDALIEARAKTFEGRFVEEAEWPDVYQVHNLMRLRIDERTFRDKDAKLRARLDELVFVAKHPNVFAKDPRVVGDDSQGDRVSNIAFEKLLEEAKGTSVHEDVAYALYEHGLGGECEGDLDCNIIALDRTACRFIRAFPSSPRTAKAIDDIIGTLDSLPPGTADVTALRDCVSKAKAGNTKRAMELIQKRVEK